MTLGASSLVSRHPVLLGVAATIVLALAFIGAVALHADRHAIAAHLPWSSGPIAPVGIAPGPPRVAAFPGAYHLDDSNAARMRGEDASYQRWCDIAGNFYASALVDDFSYADGPRVYVRIDAQAATFRGRLEARGLKPNFAYQMKLCGTHDDPASFERIGYAGRWLLPGGDTNFTDEDYRAFPDRNLTQSYILFDYFVTDAAGNAIRNFALWSSLHVLWRNTQRFCPNPDALVPVVLDLSDPQTYLRPKPFLAFQDLWAERESVRYADDDARRVFLTPGKYRAELLLTEESFHSATADGGFWAPAMRMDVAFTVIDVAAPE